jgi:hypothetical protein
MRRRQRDGTETVREVSSLGKQGYGRCVSARGRNRYPVRTLVLTVWSVRWEFFRMSEIKRERSYPAVSVIVVRVVELAELIANVSLSEILIWSKTRHSEVSNSSKCQRYSYSIVNTSTEVEGHRLIMKQCHCSVIHWFTSTFAKFGTGTCILFTRYQQEASLASLFPGKTYRRYLGSLECFYLECSIFGPSVAVISSV